MRKAPTTYPLPTEIDDRLGILARLFPVSPTTPDIAASLSAFARFAYIDNPLPSLLKDRLFVSLSRFCDVRSSVARQVAILTRCPSPACSVEDAIGLLRQPLPRGDALEPHLDLLEQTATLPPTGCDGLLAPESPAEQAVFACAAHVFLQTPQATRASAALGQALGNGLAEHLALFLVFVRAAHDWSRTHPETEGEDDAPELRAIQVALAEEVQSGACTSDLTSSLLDAIIENIPASMFLKDAADLSFVRLNRAHEELVGLPRSAMFGRTDYDFFPPDQAAFFQQKDREALSSGEVVDIPEEPLQTAHGLRWLHTRKVTVRDTDGRPTHLLGFSTNITERKRAEEELVQARLLLESRVDERTAELRASEAEARQRHHELQTIYDTSPVGLCLLDRELRFVRINDRMAELNGSPAEAHIGRTVREIVPGLADRVEPVCVQVLATGEPVIDLELSVQPGVGRTWLTSWYPQLDAGDQVLGVNVVAQEITARKQTERLLVEQKQLLERIASGCTLDEGLLAICRTLSRLTPGTRASIVLNDPSRTVAPERPTSFVRGTCHAASIVAPSGVAVGSLVLCFQEPRDASEWELRLVEFGTHVASIVLERDRANAALRESESLFRTLGEAVGDLLWMADAEGRVFYRNPAWTAYSGFSPAELAHDGWRQVLHPDDLPRFWDARARAIRTGEPFALEIRFRRRDGQYRWFRLSAVPVQDGEGWVGTTTDIHDLREAEEALREADRKKDEFLATLAHELRNPLAPIRTSLRLVERANGDWTAVERARAIMERQVGHMVVLIDDLLDVSRITRGKMVLHRELIELAVVIAHAVEAVQPLVEQHGHQLEVTISPEPVVLDGDLTRLAQVVGNLLTNAAKYTPSGGTIRLRAETRGHEVVITVSDTGIGIPPASLGRVFELFSQVDRSLEKTTGGLGIGLALVRRLVEMHGGTVAAYSEGEGLGSTFTVRLPVADLPLPTVSDTNTPVPGVQQRRVLVVDDNVDGAESLAALVALAGNEVRTAYDGLAAVEAAQAFRPDLILMDVAMPRLNGLDATRRIREQPWGRSMTIVALTGWGQNNDRERSREAGCDEHLVKPVDPRRLEELLTRDLARAS